MATSNSWSASVINKMKGLFDKGHSTAEIGKKLGFSKNAVVGKINRLGWNATPKKAIKKAPVPKKEVKPKKVAVPVTPAPVPVKKVEKAPKKADISKFIHNSQGLMVLRPDQCRWPIGSPDSDDFGFCGEKVFPGKPYCFEHCKLAYQFTTPAKKK